MDPRQIGLHRSCLGACVMTDAEFYTSVAESIDPVSAVDFINRYFGLLFRPVFDYGGFVSDLKGDGMLAVWVDGASATELRRRVCLACLEMARAGTHFSQTSGARGVGTRIGACFGPLALATVGTPAHHEYRAVGDTVNVSSRLEQLNKDLGTRILVCANLAQGLGEFLFRDLGPFQLRGKLNRVHVHELVARAGDATDAQHALSANFSIALAAYQRGRLADAHERFAELCARHPRDGAARFYLLRCQQAIADRKAGTARLSEPRAGAVLSHPF